MAVYNRMTQEKYTAIKLLLTNGATYAECAKYMKVSMNVVNRVRAAETWQEYLNMNAARVLAERERKLERKQAEQAEKNQTVTAEQADEIKPVAQVQTSEPQVVEHRQSVTVVANHYMAEQLQEQTKLLQLISNKLAYIVEQLS